MASNIKTYLILKTTFSPFMMFILKGDTEERSILDEI